MKELSLGMLPDGNDLPTQKIVNRTLEYYFTGSNRKIQRPLDAFGRIYSRSGGYTIDGKKSNLEFTIYRQGVLGSECWGKGR